MELKSYLDVILRRKWVVIVTLLVTMAVVITGTWLMTPTYSVTATLRIATASAGSTYTDYQFADRLINTYINIAASKSMLDELNKQLGLSLSPDIVVKSIPNTELIQITVEDHDPNLAVRAANTLAEILIAQSSEFYSGKGKSPADILKEQVDLSLNELNLARANYTELALKNPTDKDGIASAGKVVDLKQQIYTSLQSQYQQTRTREAIQANIISVVDPAGFPEAPAKPNKMLNISLGLIVSLMAGFGLAFIFENFDSTLFTTEQIVAVSKMRLLGSIPFIQKKSQMRLPPPANSIYSEAFLRLRTNLLPLLQVSSIKTLLITSALQGEGKSSVVANLALVLAQFHKKVIIVECDFRLATLHKTFALKNNVGMTDYLMGVARLQDVIQSTSCPDLHVITRGTLTLKPELLLETPQMKTLFPALQQMYDIVLVDPPSVLAVTDTSEIASLVDGVILVVRWAEVGKEKLVATLEQLGNVNANVIGVVVNGEKAPSQYYEYGRYAAEK